jgi:predicted nucleic acid-binding protein
VAEDGSELADEIWDAADLKVSSHLVYPEARAALAAALRAARIDAFGLRRAVADLEAAVAAIQRIGVDEALAREAGRLAQEHALRGYDAVHLATALSVDDPALLIVTWDADLAAAALRCGRSVAPALPSDPRSRSYAADAEARLR